MFYRHSGCSFQNDVLISNPQMLHANKKWGGGRSWSNMWVRFHLYVPLHIPVHRGISVIRRSPEGQEEFALVYHICSQVNFGCVLSQLCLTLVTPWNVAHQAPLSMGFPRQEYWSELPFPSPGGLPDPGIKPTSSASPAWADGFFTTWEALIWIDPSFPPA